MYEPQKRYDSGNTVQIKLKLNRKTDADLIDWLDTLENKQGTIKHLLRQEMITSRFTDALQREFGDAWGTMSDGEINNWLNKHFPEED